jgi:hypothetical protein
VILASIASAAIVPTVSAANGTKVMTPPALS